MKRIYDESFAFRENDKLLTMLSLAFPKFFQDLFSRLIGTIPTAMLSSVSDGAVAATSVANSVLSTITTALDVFAFGASILISIALGRKDRKAAGRITFIAVASTFATGLLLGVLSAIFAEPLLTLMNAEAETLRLSVEFFRIKAVFLPISVLSMTFGSLLICNAHALSSFFVGVGISVANIGSTYIALFSGLFSSPVAGIAITGTVLTGLGLVVRILIFIFTKCPFSPSFRLSEFRTLLIYGIPGKMSNFSYTFAQTFTTSFVVMLGSSIVSAKVYIGQVVAYVPLFNAAISAAGAVLIGRFRGAGNMKNVGRLYTRNVLVSVFFNTVLSVLVFLFHRPLLMIFTKDEEIIAATGMIFLIDIGVEIFRAINMVSETSLNACGKVWLTLTSSTVSCWGVSVLLSFVFSVVCGWGLVGIWLAFLTDEFVRAVFYLIVWTRTLRKNKGSLNNFYKEKELVK